MSLDIPRQTAEFGAWVETIMNTYEYCREPLGAGIVPTCPELALVVNTWDIVFDGECFLHFGSFLLSSIWTSSGCQRRDLLSAEDMSWLVLALVAYTPL